MCSSQDAPGSAESPNVEKFVAWLDDFINDPGNKTIWFTLLAEGYKPEDAPVIDGEQVYAIYGFDFFISPLAIFVKLDGCFTRIPWAEITELGHNHVKAGYIWQFKTNVGKQYDYLWGHWAPFHTFSDVVNECIAEMGANTLGKRHPQRRPIWEVDSAVRDRERWFRDYLEPRCPELVDPMRAAYSAYDETCETGTLTDANLHLIVECSRSHRSALSSNATDLLKGLIREYPEARNALTEMFQDRKSQIRFNAILCLGRSTPRDFCVELLRKALTDKSVRVRSKAADMILCLEYTELVPDLERACSVETNDKGKMSIAFDIKLLRDGYILEPYQDEGFDLTVSVRGVIKSTRISQVDIEEQGLETLVANVKKELRDSGY